MKNINQKTLIFYSFQMNPETQYNVTALKNDISQPKIKDILWHLPVDLSTGRYHFRFKSEFQEGEQKIIGWIDIMNLMAKVPIFNNSIYVKILKFKERDMSKIFTRDKLQKVGLVAMSNGSITPERKVHEKSKTTQILTTNHHSQSLGRPTNNSHLDPQGKPVTHKPKSQMNFLDENASNRSNPGSYSNLETSVPSKSEKQIGKGKGDLMDVGDEIRSNQSGNQNRKVQPETPQSILKHLKAATKKEEQEKNLELQARDQFEDTINNWGYSGKKIINNLTTLLATLHEIWPEWKQVSLGDLQREESVQGLYKKAAVQTHPDKNRKKDYRTKYLSKRIFELLNEAKKQNQQNQQQQQTFT